jgi:hypothetical protein
MAKRDAVWSAEGTTPDAIEVALRDLLIAAHEEDDLAVPARVINMIAFVDRAWAGEIANRLRGVGRYNASRLIVLSYEPRRERIDARVSIATEGSATPGQLALLRETVVVELGHKHMDDLSTIADPLVVTDLPTLLWSPHGHHDAVAELLGLSQAILLDSVEEPDPEEALRRASELSGQAYVVDLAWLRSTPWRERLAASFDPPARRPALRTITAVRIRHHPASTAAALLLAGWLSSRLEWSDGHLLAHDGTLRGKAHSSRQDVALHLQAAPELMVPGLESVSIETASGRRLRLTRGPGGLRAHSRDASGTERRWTVIGASRGEGGVLGEGIRQALLRDPTYVPALNAALAMAS